MLEPHGKKRTAAIATQKNKNDKNFSLNEGITFFIFAIALISK
jgi:hypothetical protein